jgi:hypothetical protein
MKLSAPVKILLVLVLMTGLMLTLSFYLNVEPGDVAAENRAKFSLVITLLLTSFVFIVGTARWWHPHLWRHQRNSQKSHRNRIGRHSGQKHRSRSHHSGSHHSHHSRSDRRRH